MSSGTIRSEKDGMVLRLTIDHEARRNAMTLGMWKELAQHCAMAESDPDVRVVTLTGAGPLMFCAGADISEFGEKRSTEGGVADYDRAVTTANKALTGLVKPVIAIVNGTCYGGGMGLAMACDIRIASESAKFRIPAARLGLGYGFENVAMLVNKLGAPTVADILFSARVIDAQEAYARGIVQMMFPADRLAESAAAYARTVAINAPLTIRAVKKALSELAKPPAEADAAAVDALVKACFKSADYTEGRTAFREKRDPKFTGS